MQRRPYPHRYYIKADIVRDWKWNHKVKQHIMINGILDLNQYPSAKHEGTKTVTKCREGVFSVIVKSSHTFV